MKGGGAMQIKDLKAIAILPFVDVIISNDESSCFSVPLVSSCSLSAFSTFVGGDTVRLLWYLSDCTCNSCPFSGEKLWVIILLKPEFFLSNGALLLLDPGDPLVGAFIRDLSLLSACFESFSSFGDTIGKLGSEGKHGIVGKMRFSAPFMPCHLPSLQLICGGCIGSVELKCSLPVEFVDGKAPLGS